MPLEIFQNTLLKIIARNGPDSDRKNVVLSRGEIAYTTDTKRFYVGDGTTLGGVVAGNVFKGTNNDITTLAPAVINDYAYDEDNRKLYRLKSNDGSTISDWELIGGVYVAGSGVDISSANVISTLAISANSLSQDSVASPIILDGNGRLSLSASVPIDKIVPKTGNSLTLPTNLDINGVSYTFPSSAPLGGIFQISNGSGGIIVAPLALSSISVNTITVTNGLTAMANGVVATGVAINPLSANIVIGLSPTLSSSCIFARYNGISDTLTYAKGITSVTKLGVGNYQFNYVSGTSNLCPDTQMFGLSSLTYQSRIISISNTSCVVKISNSSLALADVELTLKLTS